LAVRRRGCPDTVSHESGVFHHDRPFFSHPRPRGRDFYAAARLPVGSRARFPSCVCSSDVSTGCGASSVFHWTRWLRPVVESACRIIAVIGGLKYSPCPRPHARPCKKASCAPVRLDTLGDDSMPDAPAHGDHRRENDVLTGIDRDVEDERLSNLQLVERKLASSSSSSIPCRVGSMALTPRLRSRARRDAELASEFCIRQLSAFQFVDKLGLAVSSRSADRRLSDKEGIPELDGREC